VKLSDQLRKNRVVIPPVVGELALKLSIMHLQYQPIPPDYVARIRNSMKDDYGHAVETSIAGETGYGPCRCCLKRFKAGEKRLLFSYAPVGGDNPYNEVGPVYIHEDCSPYNETHSFPGEVKTGKLPIHLVLRCYNKNKRMILAHFVKDNNEVEKNIETLFDDPAIDFIHVRNATYQCFIAEVRKEQEN
jgi:hypothetical protein